MRRVLPSLGALGLWLLLCGFSDPKGVFTAAIDPHWQMVKDFGGLYAFAPDGDRSRGGLTIGTVPPQSSSLLGEAVATVGDTAHFVIETPYTLAGIPCLFTESRETTPGGVPTVTHNIFCYLRTMLERHAQGGVRDLEHVFLAKIWPNSMPCSGRWSVG